MSYHSAALTLWPAVVCIWEWCSWRKQALRRKRRMKAHEHVETARRQRRWIQETWLCYTQHCPHPLWAALDFGSVLRRKTRVPGPLRLVPASLSFAPPRCGTAGCPSLLSLWFFCRVPSLQPELGGKCQRRTLWPARPPVIGWRRAGWNGALAVWGQVTPETRLMRMRKAM